MSRRWRHSPCSARSPRPRGGSGWVRWWPVRACGTGLAREARGDPGRHQRWPHGAWARRCIAARRDRVVRLRASADGGATGPAARDAGDRARAVRGGSGDGLGPLRARRRCDHQSARNPGAAHPACGRRQSGGDVASRGRVRRRAEPRRVRRRTLPRQRSRRSARYAKRSGGTRPRSRCRSISCRPISRRRAPVASRCSGHTQPSASAGSWRLCRAAAPAMPPSPTLPAMPVRPAWNSPDHAGPGPLVEANGPRRRRQRGMAVSPGEREPDGHPLPDRRFEREERFPVRVDGNRPDRRERTPR